LHKKPAKACLSELPFRRMGGYQVAVQSAQNYRKLRKKEVTVRKTIDVIIGTYCIMEALPLLHSDQDFDPMVSHLSLRNEDLFNCKNIAPDVGSSSRRVSCFILYV